MGNYKMISKIFIAVSIILFGAMCAVVGYKYACFKYGGEYMGNSAPAETAFFYAVPFLILILVFIILAKKISKEK